jgi:inhibitor of KinA sporulation pathway (predicted exonuclease)
VVLIKVDTGEVVAEFHTFVRPVENARLTDLCKEFTAITQAQA